MSTARFRVVGQLDSAGGTQTGTLVIDRAAGIVYVRPLRSRRTYDMPLNMVANMICQRIIRNEVYEQQQEKKRGRRKS